MRGLGQGQVVQVALGVRAQIGGVGGAIGLFPQAQGQLGQGLEAGGDALVYGDAAEVGALARGAASAGAAPDTGWRR